MRIPLSTYRLQLRHGFGFTEARGLVAYLDRLGITDCYASPYLHARPGSTHGYDIVDHNRLNPEIGTEFEFSEFVAELRAHGMGQVLDFVPNHMGVDSRANAWWRDVLENGPSSPFASFFDIDWQPVKAELRNKVLLPILGDQYGAVLERGELQVAISAGRFTLRYFDHDLPINPQQLPRILESAIGALRAGLGEADPQFVEFLSIVTAYRNLPPYTETDPARIAERQREKEVAHDRLNRLVSAAPHIRDHIDAAVQAINGQVGQPATFDALDALLAAQVYRLSYWRTAAHEINYRRFFDINELAGLRMEDPRVFDATHGLVLRLITEGAITGLRLDHIDGLFDPGQYLERLHAAIHGRQATPGGGASGGPALYVVVEKILSSGETLPAHWQAAGTSGYDFLNDVNGVFIDRRNQRMLKRIYRRFSKAAQSFGDIVYASKKLIMDAPMASELNVLAQALNRLSERDRRTRDFTLNSLRDALQEVVACLPIYRTYVRPSGFTAADQAAIDAAVRRARRRNPTMEPSIFEFLRQVLLPDHHATPSSEDYGLRLGFAMRFQQYSGPVQAKGVEDTAFYRYNVLASLNSVGGDPERFGREPAEFHAANQWRRDHWPYSMLATATHDTKRGEDVRARLNVLSEMPEEWGRQLAAWARINAGHRSVVEGEPAPDRNDRYLFYQTLLGIWPPGVTLPDESVVARLQAYMVKAVREAKVHTSWTTQNAAYETALTAFVERTLTSATAPRFFAAFLPFQQQVARLGMVNALSQLVLKVASPGVPDFYQGTELWDLNLVDPDNRQLVDFGHRKGLLDKLESELNEPEPAIRSAAVSEMLAHWEDGRIKLFVTAALLRERRRMASVFLDGTYEPLEAAGERAAHVVGFVRRHEGQTVIAVVPRLPAALTSPAQPVPLGEGCWRDTYVRLPGVSAGELYRNVVTGEQIRCADQGSLALANLCGTAPIVLLVQQRQQ